MKVPRFHPSFLEVYMVNYSEVSISSAPPVNKPNEDLEVNRVTELNQEQPSRTHKTAPLCQPRRHLDLLSGVAPNST